MSRVWKTLDTLPRHKWGKRFYYEQGRYCALGWLGVRMGMSDDELYNGENIRLRIMDHFDLDDDTYDALGLKNDEAQSLDEVVSWLKERSK